MNLKNLRATATGLLFWIVLMILIGAVVAMFLAGTLWITSLLAPLAWLLAGIGTLLLPLLLTVSAVSPRSRRFCGQGIALVSYSWGIALWMWATLALYQLWGVFGLFTGFVLVGVGSVPTACVALLFHGQFRAVIFMIVAVMLLFAVRTLGLCIAAKGSTRHSDDEPGSELPALPFNAPTRSESGHWVVGQAFTEEYESLAVSPVGLISTPVSQERLRANHGLGGAIEIRDINDPWLTTFIHMRTDSEYFIAQQATGFAWSPDGRYLVVATCTRDGEPDVLAYLDVNERRHIRFIGDYTDSSSCIAWSGRGNYVAVSSQSSNEDYPLRLWRFKDGDLHYTEFLNFDKPSEHLLGVRMLAFAPDERFLMAVAGSRI